MYFLWATLLTLFNLGCLFLIVLGLPGAWLMIIATALFAWLYGEADVSQWTLLFLVGLATLGELMEFTAGVIGARGAGGSPRGAIGALLGGMVGAIAGTFVIPVPVIGSLLGACGGAFLGATTLEWQSGRGLTASVRSGVGAGVGRFVGTLAKLAVGVAVFLVASRAVLSP